MDLLIYRVGKLFYFIFYIDAPEAEEEAQLALAREQMVANVTLGDASCRFAVMHLDWEMIRAVDLFVVFSSFLPTNGVLKRVAVIQSDFGVEKMKEDQIRAPAVFADDKNLEANGAEGEVFNEALLRKYELDKLKYFYAVAEFDSVDTAAHVYEECDGLEFQKSSNMLDLRFIADSFVFPDREPRDEAFEIPAKYRPPDFTTGALQHTKLELSWERGDKMREAMLTKVFNEEKMSDFQAYLGSESDPVSGSDVAISVSGSDEEDEESTRVYLKKKVRAKYAKLLEEIKPSETLETDMEITFVPGLKEIGKKILKDKDEKDRIAKETPMERTAREKKEKKKAAKKELIREEENLEEENAEPAAAIEDDDINLDEDDPFFKSLKKKAGSKPEVKSIKKKAKIESTEEDVKQRALLEMMMSSAKTDAEVAEYDLKALIKAKKAKTKKAKYQKDVVEDNFKVNVEDNRFSSLYLDPNYAIDPTDKLFKNTQGMSDVLEVTLEKRKELLAEREKTVRVQKEQKKAKLNSKAAVSEDLEAPEVPTQSISSLISSVKQKLPKFAYASKKADP